MSGFATVLYQPMPDAAPRCAVWPVRLWRALLAARRRRKMMRALAACDDRTLRDIGLDRGLIGYLAGAPSGTDLDPRLAARIAGPHA